MTNTIPAQNPLDHVWAYILQVYGARLRQGLRNPYPPAYTPNRGEYTRHAGPKNGELVSPVTRERLEAHTSELARDFWSFVETLMNGTSGVVDYIQPPYVTTSDDGVTGKKYVWMWCYKTSVLSEDELSPAMRIAVGH